MSDNLWWMRGPTFIQQCPMCNAIHENRRAWDEYCDQHSPYSERVGRVSLRGGEYGGE